MYVKSKYHVYISLSIKLFSCKLSLELLLVLCFFSLKDKSISNLSPTIFTKLTSLKELNVDGNQITKVPIYATFCSLKTLNITHNKLQSVDEVVHCLNLEHLDISGNEHIQVCIILFVKTVGH